MRKGGRDIDSKDVCGKKIEEERSGRWEREGFKVLWLQ